MIAEYRPLAALVLVYIALALWMSVRVPPFEAPDAYYHFAVIEHRARTGGPPALDVQDAQNQPWRQMAFHAPLYYELSAGLIHLLGVDTGDFRDTFRLNPHAQIGEPGATDNRNFIAHVSYPWEGSGLAVRLVRGLSIALGALTLIAIYTAARLLFPERRAVAALAVAGVLAIPQFVFIHSVVTNDTLVTTLSTVALAILIAQMQRGVTPWGVLALALVLAFGSIAKTSGMTLYPVVALGMLWACWRQRVGWRRVVGYGALGLAAWAIIAGGWYWGNWQALGDPTATRAIAEVTGARTGGIADLAGELGGMVYSFWGLFGWFNVPAPPAFYDLAALFSLVVAGGWGWSLWRARGQSLPPGSAVIAGLLGLYAGVYLASWWQFHTLVNAAQGRLLFPLLLPFSLVIGLGLAALPRVVGWGATAALGLATVALPVAHIAPAYAPAPPVDPAAIPASARAFDFRQPWEDAPCLRAWVLPAHSHDDGITDVRVWWQALCPISGYWSVFLHWVDVERETCVAGITDYILAQVDTMPDGGRRPFPRMAVGEVYADRFSIARPHPLPDDRPVWHLQFGLYDAGGTFMRAFVSGAPDAQIGIGRCAPESLQFTLSG